MSPTLGRAPTACHWRSTASGRTASRCRASAPNSFGSSKVSGRARRTRSSSDRTRSRSSARTSEIRWRSRSPGRKPKTFRITGRGITPPIGDQGHFGEGAFLDYSGLLRIFEGGPPPQTLFVIFKPGVDHARGISDLRERIGSETEGITVDAPGLPGDLVNFGRVQNLPVILAGLLAFLASATLAHALITSIRQRRRDLAVLKTMGFVRGQIHAAVAWQATTLALVAVSLGVPLGIIGGRSLWTLFANELGVEPIPSRVLRGT